MASVLALVDPKTFKRHAKRATLGKVLPIDRYLTRETSFATELSMGGAIYLASSGPAGELWLVAVLEAPECARIRVGDRREPGWYAIANTVPVTDISKLRKRLGIGTDLDDSLDPPVVLTPAKDRALRVVLDDVDAPVIAVGTSAPSRPPALDPDRPPLARAASYLAGGYVNAAIEAIVDAWRASRVPELADLVDRATRLTPEYHQPMFARRVRWKHGSEATKVWKAALPDAATAMPQLLLNLTIGGGTDLPRRAQLLAELPDDPRIGARLVELIPSAPEPGAISQWLPILEIWMRAKDVRTRASILELEPLLTGARQADELFEWAAASTVPELAVTDREHVAKIERDLERLEEPLRTERALIDEIVAHRDDDGPYLVYADWLIEHGRPLGEYIALECSRFRGTLTSAQARRLDTLVEVPYLAGAFDDLPSSRVRKRVRGIDRDLSSYWTTPPRSWQLFATSPLVRAVESLRLIGAPREQRAEAIAELVAAAPALRRIADVGEVGRRLCQFLGPRFVLAGDDLVRG